MRPPSSPQPLRPPAVHRASWLRLRLSLDRLRQRTQRQRALAVVLPSVSPWRGRSKPTLGTGMPTACRGRGVPRSSRFLQRCRGRDSTPTPQIRTIAISNSDPAVGRAGQRMGGHRFLAPRVPRSTPASVREGCSNPRILSLTSSLCPQGWPLCATAGVTVPSARTLTFSWHRDSPRDWPPYGHAALGGRPRFPPSRFSHGAARHGRPWQNLRVFQPATLGSVITAATRCHRGSLAGPAASTDAVWQFGEAQHYGP
ncbi:uncharacterized protein BDZ99DRAFT_532074 [Mytilinidion resinicola]|uniref:Uncharacterized protein n=1 Tax=Mytilinidion resinicola TaxID=574789 RepID=A0A6A6YL34_9PEZI|nr:uncharacterized protein BDZ99DRAFT_532074 [Mytilinidion resinicola]KAF2809586.1 hypothetical protein BDZ99DRAFT_532074 [Mytilinidion resinicola]